MLWIFSLDLIYSSEYDDVPFKIKGGYKKCTVYHLDYKFDKPDENSKEIFDKYFYNDNGFIIDEESIICSSCNKIKYRYNNLGLNNEILYYTYNGTLSSKEIIQFDSTGRKINSSIYNDNGYLYQKFIFIYDKNGNLIEEKEEDLQTQKNKKTKKIEFQNIKKFKYDERGNIIEQVNLRFNKIESKIAYFYDDKNKLIESILLNCYNIQAVEITNKYRYFYDINGNLSEKIEFDSIDEPKCKWVYIYEYY
jgi:hypothetical protein